MKVTPDTKDWAFFTGGWIAVVVQFVGYYLLAVEPSWPLVVMTGGFLGVPVVSEFDRRRSARNGDS